MLFKLWLPTSQPQTVGVDSTWQEACEILWNACEKQEQEIKTITRDKDDNKRYKYKIDET